MRTTTLAVLLAVLPSPLPVRTCAADDPVTVQPKPLPAASAITAVTLYQGRAQVTRSASPTLEPGVWEIRFAGLPAATVAESLQASVGSPAKLLDVRFESRVLPEDASTQPERKEIESALHRLRDEIAAAAAERETLLGSIQILDALAPRVAQSTGKDLGSGGFDPERVRAQLAALAQERDLASRAIIAIDEANRKRDDERAALAARAASLGGGGTVERTGIAVVAMTGDTTTVPIDLLYQTGEATWTPTYSLRAASDLSGLAVDYEAAIRQQTGEAWDNVKLTLSTATPTRPAGPPPIEPVYVQAFEMKPAAGRIMSVEAAAPPPPPPLPPGEAEAPAKADWAMNARRAADDAAVTQNATAATYVLPRTVSLPSDSRREQKTRIASIDLKPDYSYVTRPAADPAVFLRGKTRNDSPTSSSPGRPPSSSAATPSGRSTSPTSHPAPTSSSGSAPTSGSPPSASSSPRTPPPAASSPSPPTPPGSTASTSPAPSTSPPTSRSGIASPSARTNASSSPSPTSCRPSPRTTPTRRANASRGSSSGWSSCRRRRPSGPPRPSPSSGT